MFEWVVDINFTSDSRNLIVIVLLSLFGYFRKKILSSVLRSIERGLIAVLSDMSYYCQKQLLVDAFSDKVFVWPCLRVCLCIRPFHIMYKLV